MFYDDCFEKIKDEKSTLIYGKLLDNCDFTVCIPIYGIRKFLKETISNIKEIDKYGMSVQVIVSNNGKHISEDELNEYFGDLDNIAVFSIEKSIGQNNNFNRCIQLSNSNYLTILHDDDLLIKNYFQFVKKSLTFLDKRPNIGMIHQKQIVFNDVIEEKNIRIMKIYKKTPFEISVDGGSRTGFPTCGIILNKRICIMSGGYTDAFPSSGDAFLSIAMIEKGFDIYQSVDYLGYYRIADNNSLKLDICKGFIKEDVYFRKYWYEKSLFRKLYFKIFGRFLYSTDIDTKVKFFSNFNSEISIDNLDYLNNYKCYGKISFCRILYHGFQILKKMFIKIHTKSLK